MKKLSGGRYMLSVEEMKKLSVSQLWDFRGITQICTIMNLNGVEVTNQTPKSIEDKLKENGINTIFDLVTTKFIRLSKMNKVGIYTIGVLNDVLYSFNLKIGMDPIDFMTYNAEYKSCKSKSISIDKFMIPNK